MTYVSKSNFAVSLIRASDGEVFPICTNREYSEASSNSYDKTCLVNDGDTFFIRVDVKHNFGWRKSNALLVQVKYNHPTSIFYHVEQDRQYDHRYDFPLIAKPEGDRQAVTVDLDRCYTWNGIDWRSNTTRFLHIKVPSPKAPTFGKCMDHKSWTTSHGCKLLTNS